MLIFSWSCCKFCCGCVNALRGLAELLLSLLVGALTLARQVCIILLLSLVCDDVPLALLLLPAYLSSLDLVCTRFDPRLRRRVPVLFPGSVLGPVFRLFQAALLRRLVSGVERPSGNRVSTLANAPLGVLRPPHQRQSKHHCEHLEEVRRRGRDDNNLAALPSARQLVANRAGASHAQYPQWPRRVTEFTREEKKRGEKSNDCAGALPP